MPDFLVFTTIIPKLLGAKVLLDLHEPTPELWQTKYGDRLQSLLHLQIRLEQSAIEYADAAITVTDELRDRVIERGAQPNKISIVRNVCDESLFSGLLGKSFDKLSPGRAKRQRDGLCLITHGLIEERYGHEETIKAVSSLRDKIPNLHLEILGSGEWKTQLIQLVDELCCADMVEFAGYVADDKLMRRLQAADVGVIAMRRSPYSELIDTNKMYEFMVLRKPIIISRLQPIAHRFDDSCVKFFEPGDYQDLARCVLELYQDPGWGHQLAENAYQRYEKMRWQYAKQTYLQVIERLVTQN
jgi:glycosyltransferase involved in cell wall biosynthesis